MIDQKRKICVVTGTRAEYGSLYWVMREIEKAPDFQLQIIATGMHLSPEFGLTYKDIVNDGFNIDEKVEMLLSSDTANGVAKSMGLGTIGFADAYRSLKPDLVVLLGDRFELLSAAQSALVAKIPLAHLVGGDTTEGAFDEAIRHSITKMSHLHFVTNELSRNRVCQMGENPEHVYNVGSPGLDYIRKVKLLDKAELEKALEFKLFNKNLLITFHPVTLDNAKSTEHFKELLNALEHFSEEIGLLFTLPNADTEGRSLINMVETFASKHPHAKAFTSLGQLLYLSTMAHVDAVVGNSSSGLYEAPSFKIPTVNIGDRQKGRLRATSVIDCEPEAKAIVKALEYCFVKDFSDTVNLYGDGYSSEKIVDILKTIPDYRALIKKRFFEWGNTNG